MENFAWSVTTVYDPGIDRRDRDQTSASITGDLMNLNTVDLITGSGPGGERPPSGTGSAHDANTNILSYAGNRSQDAIRQHETRSSGEGDVDLIVGAGPGGAHDARAMRTFDGLTGVLRPGFFAFDPNLQAGTGVVIAGTDGGFQGDHIGQTSWNPLG